MPGRLPTVFEIAKAPVLSTPEAVKFTVAPTALMETFAVGVGAVLPGPIRATLSVLPMFRMTEITEVTLKFEV